MPPVELLLGVITCCQTLSFEPRREDILGGSACSVVWDLRGWIGYFALEQHRSFFDNLDKWLSPPLASLYLESMTLTAHPHPEAQTTRPIGFLVTMKSNGVPTWQRHPAAVSVGRYQKMLKGAIELDILH